MAIFRRISIVPVLIALTVSATIVAQAGGRPATHASLLGSLSSTPSITASTVATNGDGNPYGVAVVPSGFPAGGAVAAGDILVSNFNNSGGKQGEGTTIVAVTPAGRASTFFGTPRYLLPVGLSTALVALKSGVVVVGNTPTTDGTSATAHDGSLIFIDKNGHVLLNLTDSALLRGPWDMTANDSNPNSPVLFVSNVLSGTITRIDVKIQRSGGRANPQILRMTQIASGFLHRTDPAALLVGPTGLLLGKGSRAHSLYVADTGSDSITRIDSINGLGHSGTGTRIASGGPLEGPLGLAWAPNGDIVASNGDAAGPPQTPSNINRVVEVNPSSRHIVASKQLDTTGTAGAIFGITIAVVKSKESLVYVNDNTNSVVVLPKK